MAISRIHPQFFQTLVPGFHTHFTIPEDFFSKYIEERNVAELKLDSSDKTWKVNLSDRRLTNGWEEFAVANDFQIGDVVLVRYVGDMVFNVSDLGPNYSEFQDNEGKHLLKKRLHSRTQVEFSSNNNGYVDDDDDDEEEIIEFPRKKKAKNSQEAEAETEVVSSSSSADNSCFVALVTASNLRTDTLYLPQYFTSSNGLTRKCRRIVLTDGGERSWALELIFNESSNTFYISRGWRIFCDANGQKAGGFFLFKLVGNGESLVLRFDPTESNCDTRQRDCSEASKRESVATKVSSKEENIAGKSSEDECEPVESLMETEQRKYRVIQKNYSSYSPRHKKLVTFTLPPDHVRTGRLCLPAPFLKDNGITKPGEIYLLDRDGKKWSTNLRQDKGTMRLGKGWKEFAKASGLKTSFTLKLIWEGTTPVLSLCCGESNNDKGQEEFPKAIEKQSLFIDPINGDKNSNNENKKEENMACETKKNHLKGKQFVTLTITPSSVERNRIRLSKIFTIENDINKPGMITLLGKDGIKQQATLLFDKSKGSVSLGNGWKDFVKENGLKTGDTFTLKLIWEDRTPVLSLCPAECSIDIGAGGECSKTNQKKSLPIRPSSCKRISKDENIKDDNNKEETSKEESRSMEKEKKHLSGRDSIPSSQKQIVKLKITPSSVKKKRLIIFSQFARENSINKPGMIYLSDTDGRKWLTSLQRDNQGTVSVGKGWIDFAEANDLLSAESLTVELVWEDTTPMLRLFRPKSSSSKANKKESIPSEPNSSDSSPTLGENFVTLVLTPEDVKACKLVLPSQYMKANDINKLGKITILGENGMECSAYLLSRDGTVALGNGWKDYCEANGVKLGESFTLELINEQDTTAPLLKFSSLKTNYNKDVN